jgi:VWFA-related protein
VLRAKPVFVLSAAFIGAIVVAATLPLGGRAQTPAQQQPPPPTPTFRTEVNYIRVDAYPTRNGAPIPDLTRDDFQIFENGQPQQIDQFERVVVKAAGPQESRVEPNTVAESRAMAESSRARVFVLFLDVYHVDAAAARKIRRPLIDALDRLIGQDDLIGVMTPEMSANDIAFARKTTTIEGILDRFWKWGERDTDLPVDPEDRKYGECYPNEPAISACADQNGVAAKMIDRRHEKRTLDALEDLVKYLRGVREERKAILALSNGWLRFKPDYSLMAPLACEGPPSAPSARVDPNSGKLTTKSTEQQAQSNACSIDRINLAQIDDDRLFKDIMDEANRANATFYPIDPRGLAVFDTPIVRTDVPGPPPPMTPPSVDQSMLRGRITSLRTLAESTDGLAIVDSNDLAGGLKRIVDDTSAYYLLGYYSSGKLDGKFHSISVKIKRPGVQVRARRGYLAATEAEAARATRIRNGDAPATTDAEALAVESVLSPLSAFSREATLRLRSAIGWTSDGRQEIWLVGELGTADAWRLGAESEITLSKDGETVATAHATVAPGGRAFRINMTPSHPLAAGEYSFDVRTTATSKLASSGDLLQLAVPASPSPVGSLLVRRGPFTGPKEMPTADLRFRRSEQLRVEVPIVSSTPSSSSSARLLDRNGKAMAVPITTANRDDADGSKWVTAQVPLTPLGPGDYIVEVMAGNTKTLTPIRIVQ